MPTTIRVIGALLLSVAILSAPSTIAQEQRPAATPGASPSGAGLSIVDQRPVEGDFGRILGMSPDGRWLAGLGDNVLCVYSVETLAEHQCATLDGRIDLEGVTRSPDGTRIAFTENSPQFLVDSDIWVFEAATGTLTNLTDDGYRGGIPLSGSDRDVPSPLYLDVAPAWTPDGQSLAFSRTTWIANGDSRTDIYRLNQGGEPELLVAIPGQHSFLIYLGMRWTPDGEHLLFTVSHPQFDNQANGIWMVNADGTGLRQLAGATNPELGYPMLADISAQGLALVFFFHPFFDVASGWTPYGLVDIATGELTFIEAASDNSPITLPSAAGFSPDGAYLLYGTNSDRLIIRDLSTGEEHLLAEDIKVVPRANTFTDSLTLAANGTVYAPSSPTGGMLLELGDG